MHTPPRVHRQLPIIILALPTVIIPQPHQFHPPNDGMPSWMFGVASGVDCLNSAGGSCKDLGQELGVNHATPSCHYYILGCNNVSECSYLIGWYLLPRK
jgi:hypothetical protein